MGIWYDFPRGEDTGCFASPITVPQLIYIKKQILTGQQPFFEIKSDIAVVFEVVLKGARPIRPKDEARINDTVWTLVEACWSKNPAARPNSRSVALILDLIAGARVGLDASTILHLLETNPETSATDIVNSRRGRDE